jgi:predicted metal-dependent hydrolase
MSLQIGQDGIIYIKAPHGTPKFFIRRFLESHQLWIEKHKKWISNNISGVKKQFVNGDSFLYLGVTHTLHIGPYKTLGIKDTRILFPNFLKFRIKKELTNWYQHQAKICITSIVEEYAKRMGVSYSEIYFSVTTSKWGSCSYDNKLQFNWHLIMAPLLVIRYVVIHELTHTMIKNHSRKFWAKVEEYNPSYRQQRKWLREHGHSVQEI